MKWLVWALAVVASLMVGFECDRAGAQGFQGPLTMTTTPSTSGQCPISLSAGVNKANWGTCGSGGGGITALTGDVTASGTGSVTATAVSFNGGTLFGSAAGFAATAFSPALVNNNIGTTGTTTVTAAQWNAGNSFSVTTSGVTLQLPVSTSVTANSTLVIVTGANTATLTPNSGDAINGGTAGASVTIAAKSNVYVTTDAAGHLTVGGYAAGGGTPCTTTALSLQYNASGSFGCVANWTSDASNLILSGAVNGDIATYNSSHALVDSGTLLSNLPTLAASNSFTGSNTFNSGATGTTTFGGGSTGGLNVHSVAPAASTAAIAYGGTLNTGNSTTSFPYVYAQFGSPSASTVLSTNGTIWGANVNSGSIICEQFMVNGVSEFSVGCSGSLTNKGGSTLQGNSTMNAAGASTYAIGNTGNLGLFSTPGRGTDATLSDATDCTVLATHVEYFGSGTGGICLTTSARDTKNDINDLVPDLFSLLRIQPRQFHYKKGFGDNGVKLQYGYVADEVEPYLPLLVGHDKHGKANSVDYGGFVPILVNAVKQLAWWNIFLTFGFFGLFGWNVWLTKKLKAR